VRAGMSSFLLWNNPYGIIAFPRIAQAFIHLILLTLSLPLWYETSYHATGEKIG